MSDLEANKIHLRPLASTATVDRPAAMTHSVTPRELPEPSAAGDARAPSRAAMIARHFDVVLVLLAAPIALPLGTPVLGYLVGAAAWLLQSVVGVLDRRWLRAATEPRTQLGLNLAEAFGRIWLLAGAIVIAGVAGGRSDGLTAAVTVFGAYSVAFVIRVITGPVQPPRGGTR